MLCVVLYAQNRGREIPNRNKGPFRVPKLVAAAVGVVAIPRTGVATPAQHRIARDDLARILGSTP